MTLPDPRNLLAQIEQGAPLTDREWLVLLPYCFPNLLSSRPSIDRVMTPDQWAAIRQGLLSHLNLMEEA